MWTCCLLVLSTCTCPVRDELTGERAFCRSLPYIPHIVSIHIELFDHLTCANANSARHRARDLPFVLDASFHKNTSRILLLAHDDLVNSEFCSVSILWETASCPPGIHLPKIYANMPKASITHQSSGVCTSSSIVATHHVPIWQWQASRLLQHFHTMANVGPVQNEKPVVICSFKTPRLLSLTRLIVGQLIYHARHSITTTG